MTTRGNKGVGLGGLRGQMIALQGPWGPRSRPRGSRGVKRWAYRIPGGHGLGQQGPEGQGVGLQGPRGSRSRPVGCQGVNRVV